MANMNYKPLIVDKLKEYNEELPEYSIGEILYSVLKEISTSKTIDRTTIRTSLSDNMFYQALNKSLSQEKEDEFFNK